MLNYSIPLQVAAKLVHDSTTCVTLIPFLVLPLKFKMWYIQNRSINLYSNYPNKCKLILSNHKITFCYLSPSEL